MGGRPRPHVEKPPEQQQGTQAVGLRQQHLQHDGELLRLRALLRAEVQPHLESSQLLLKERGRLE
jgi:hypothetical protein